jgi:hypothetical protein
VGRSVVCAGERSCVRTGRLFRGSRVSECCTGHWVGGADADFDEDAWSTGQLAAEDEDGALFAREE